MKKSRFTESPIVAVLKEGEVGLPVAELCRKHGIGIAKYYLWKSTFSGCKFPSCNGYARCKLKTPSSNTCLPT